MTVYGITEPALVCWFQRIVNFFGWYSFKWIFHTDFRWSNDSMNFELFVKSTVSSWCSFEWIFNADFKCGMNSLENVFKRSIQLDTFWKGSSCRNQLFHNINRPLKGTQLNGFLKLKFSKWHPKLKISYDFFNSRNLQGENIN